jgi:hypothetical protein
MWAPESCDGSERLQRLRPFVGLLSPTDEMTGCQDQLGSADLRHILFNLLYTNHSAGFEVLTAVVISPGI